VKNELVKFQGAVGLKISESDNKAFSMLLPQQQKFINAALQPKIADIEPMKCIEALIAIITTAYTIAGQQLPADNGKTLAIYADEFYSTICLKFPRVTLEEVRTALRAGVYDEYGDYYGLNPKSFLFFLKSYLFSIERKEAAKIFQQKQLIAALPVSALPPEQKDRDDKDFINFLFEQYKKKQMRSLIVPEEAYNILKRTGAISYSADIMRKIKRKARRIRIKQLYDEKTAKLIDGLDVTANKIGQTVDLFAAGNEPTDEKDLVKIIARKIAVLYFFAQCNVGKMENIF
jgi:hypothetical protein